MKVNLRKIGAIVAGATILASTAAFGALWYGNTQLVDANGAPLAKVVVGEKGAASDGVAAALIAGRMVNSGYKSVALSGKVVGTATCTEGTGTGGCTVTDEKAKIEISVPGAVAEGTATVNTLIGDYLNRRLLDRGNNTAADTNAEYPMSTSDVSENANPFTDGAGSNIGVSETFLYRISGSAFSPFATATITDDNAGKTYSEEQNMWLRGKTYYDDSNNAVVGEMNFLAYTLKFKGAADDFGIPFCTTPTGNDYTSCTSDYQTETHKVQVNFLGEKWIISDMSVPALVASSKETMVYNGGYVKLAKESVSGILNQGESLPVDNLKFHLDDLEAHGDTTSAIVSVLDANDNVLKKDKVDPASTKEFNINGRIYRFHVYKVAPGYTYGAKWADVAVYAKELKLSDADNLDPDYDNNENYQVVVGWKDKGAGTNSTPDHLRMLGIYGDDIAALSTSDDTKMNKGDYIPVVEDPVAWKLSYNGLDLTSADRSSLKLSMERNTDLTISTSKGPYISGTSTGASCTIKAPYVKVESGKSGSVFEITGYTGDSSSTTTLTSDQFYVASALSTYRNYLGNQSYYGFYCDASGATGPYGLTAYNMSSATANVTMPRSSADLLAAGSGTIFMKVSSAANSRYGYAIYGWVNSSIANPRPMGSLNVSYIPMGDGDTTWAKGGQFEVAHYNNSIASGQSHIGDSFGNTRVTVASGSTADWYFGFSEKAGLDTSNDYSDQAMVGLDINGGSSTFNYDSQDSSSNYITKKDYCLYRYAGPATAATTVATLEEGGYTERGSIFSSIDDTSVTFNMANKVAKAQFYLASATTNASSTSTCMATLAEGGEYTCSGVKVKVLDITETATCTGAGASAACTANMASVTAKVVDPTGAEVASAYVPNKEAYKGLVILDRDAAGVNTLVAVGGDKVNTVTKSLLESSPVDWTTEKKIVKEVVQGQKIVVAGADASDTLAATNDFLTALREA